MQRSAVFAAVGIRLKSVELRYVGLGGGIGRRDGLKIHYRKVCRFESGPRHQHQAASAVFLLPRCTPLPSQLGMVLSSGKALVCRYVRAGNSNIFNNGPRDRLFAHASLRHTVGLVVRLDVGCHRCALQLSQLLPRLHDLLPFSRSVDLRLHLLCSVLGSLRVGLQSLHSLLCRARLYFL